MGRRPRGGDGAFNRNNQMTSEHYRWRPVRHPLRLVTQRGWRWGRDPRASVCLVSPRGTVYEVRQNRGIPHKGRLTVQTNCDNTHWENAYNYAATVGTNDVLVLRRPACASAMQVRLVLEVEP
jgi:hypothetical protein